MRYRLSPQRKYRQQRPRFVGTVTRPRLSLRGVARAPIAGRLRLYQASTVVPDIASSLWDPDHVVQQATLADARSRTWYDPMNEPGNWSMILQNDNTDLPLVDFKDLVDFIYRGANAATGIVESMERFHIDPGEEAGEFTTITGRLHVALLEKAILYPTLGASSGIPRPEQDRHFNWSVPSYDDSGWGIATVVTDVFNSQTIWPVPWPVDDFPDGSAFLLWASDGTTLSAGVGTCWFRQAVNAAVGGWYHVYFAADNNGDFYIDGQLLVSSTFPQNSSVDVLLGAGAHTIAVRGENLTGVGTNPAAVVWSVWYTETQGGGLQTLLGRSDASVKIVEYSNDPPGITAGFVLGLALAEMQARGILTGMTLTFSDSADSRGQPWPLLSDVTTRVGNDMLSFAIEMAQAGYIDFWMTPGMFELNAAIGGTRGT